MSKIIKEKHAFMEGRNVSRKEVKPCKLESQANLQMY